MDILALDRAAPRYPPTLMTYLRDDAPLSIAVLGNLDILQARTLALFSSIKCPGTLILKTYDLAQNLRERRVTVIGGFHSPMEQECLKILSRGKQPIIICPARSIGAKTVREHAYGIEQGRLLILSPFSDKDSRITAEAAEIRNRFAAALADALFIAYAAPGGQMEQLCLEVITWGKPLYTFADEANAHLIAIGAKTVTGDWTP